MRLLFCAVLALVGCGTLPTPSDPGPVGAERPNIVYVLTDDLGYGDVSCLNVEAAWQTPNIDRCGAEGMIFTDAHSGSSVCTPTRYGLLTGRYAWRTRLADGVLWGTSAPLIAAGRMTVASLLREHGYHTACIGKWHLGWDFALEDGRDNEVDFEQPVTNGPDTAGFDEYYCIAASLDIPPYVYVANGRITARPDRETEGTDKKGFWRKGPTGADFVHEDVLTNFTTHAVTYVQERARTGEPFFLYLPLPAPHTPILPSAGFRGASGTNAYGDYVLEVDACLGKVLAAIDASGLKDRTIVVVTSDNGCSPAADFAELARYGHDPSAWFRGHKADIYDGGHRIPFVVRWPGHVPAGQRCAQTICLTDWLRTCADLLGTTLPDDAGEDSSSFLAALTGTGHDTPREAVVHHSVNGSFAIRQGRWKLALCPGSGGWSEPTPEKARDQRLPLRQLFDLDADPGELHNLAGEHPEIADRLVACLQRYVETGRSTPGAAQPNDRTVTYLPEPYPETRD